MQYVWSPTLGTFQDSPEKIWGVTPYKSKTKPTVFCGIYSLKDLQKVKEHKGKRYVWWCGTDITRLIKGYWLDEKGKKRVSPQKTADWISCHCESWVENYVEAEALAKLGINAHVCPSFLGDVKQFKIKYKFHKKPKLYTSVSGDDFKLYGWDKIPKLAIENPDVEFHLYGNTKHPFDFKHTEIGGEPFDISIYPDNIKIHGRVPKEQFNKEIEDMQGGLRLTTFDGFSEIIAKSVLMGQYPVSLIDYPYTLDPRDIDLLFQLKEPNIEGREHYLQEINNFPWNENNK